MVIFKVKRLLRGMLVIFLLTLILVGCKKNNNNVKRYPIDIRVGEEVKITDIIDDVEIDFNKHIIVSTNTEIVKCEGNKVIAVSTGTVTVKVMTEDKKQILYEILFTVDDELEVYTIEYHFNGGTPHPETKYSYDEDQLPLLLMEPTLAGHRFMGWYTTEDFTGERVTEIPVNSTGKKVFYARWAKDLDDNEEIEYSIIYYTNGGELSDPPTKYTNSKLPLVLPEPTRKGYVFAGWYTDEDFTNRVFSIEKDRVGEISVYAKWEKLQANEYSIVYNLNGGIIPTPINKYSEDNLPLRLPTPTREGYQFIGWFIDKDLTTAVSIIEKGSTGDFVVYAKWEEIIVDYQITYELDGGELVDPINTYNKKSLPLVLQIPYREGYKFIGWYREASFINKVTRLEVDQTGNLTLYAKWEKDISEYTIQYELNAGVLNNPVLTYTEDTLPLDLPIPTRDGYVFKGWYDSSDFAGAEVKRLEIGTVGNKTFYAKWEEVVVEYTITYNLNDGKLSNPINKYNKNQLPLTLPTPTLEGSTFVGWYLDASFNTELNVIPLGTTGNITVYAKWVLKSTEYQITYELNGGTWGYTNKNELATDFLTDFYNYLGKPGENLTTFMHGEGQTGGFKGIWQDQLANLYAVNDKTADASKQYFINQPEYNSKWIDFFEMMEEFTKAVNETQSFWGSTFTGHLRLKQYITGEKPADYVKDELMEMLPNVSKSVNVYRSDRGVLLGKPKRNGYEFVGWYENSNFVGSPIFEIKAGTIGNKKLYAKWVKVGEIEEFTITYNLDGGGLSGQKTKFKANELPYVLPKPTKTGYQFVGWYTDDKFINKIDKLEVVGNIILYARWEKLPEYTITYNLNGGTISGEKEVFTQADLPYQLPIPTRSGYVFAGWFTDSNFTVKVTKVESIGNKTYYAKWEKVDEDQEFTITYNLNGGSISNPKTKFKLAQLPLTLPTPTRSGYKFVGWFLSANLSGHPITVIAMGTAQNISLYAKWEEESIEYTIEYVLNGGKFAIASKDDLKKEFLTDLYNYLGKPGGNLTTFMHGAGKTAGFDGTWQDHLTNLYAVNDKSSDDSKQFFINQPQYNSKWVPFFDLLDQMIKEVNSTQSFWGSVYTGHIRLKEWIKGERWQDDNRMPTNLGALLESHKKYTRETLPITLPIPTRDGFTFEGWYETADFSSNKVTSLAVGTTGNKVFYAKWKTQPYSISYKLNGGSWYTSKDDFKKDFLTDFYNYLGKPGGNLTTFMHGAGKTSGYAGTWVDHLDKLYAINDKSSDPNKEYFINQPVYNKKWLPFFNWMETLVKETNETQSFWGSTYTGGIRLKEYMQNTRYQDKSYPSNVVRGYQIYESGIGLDTLPTPTMTGGKFLGWYTAQTGGTKVTSIAKGTTGNITLYARWEVTGPPAGSVYLRLGFSGNGTLKVGQSMKINYTAVVTGNYQADAVTWSSSDTSVATVDQNGNVKAVGVGSAVITARTVASGAISHAGVTVYNDLTHALLQHLIQSNTGVLFSKNIVYYGYQGNYTNRVSNTANKFLPETLSINKSLWLPTSRANHPNVKMSSIEFITVHDTGSSSASSNARANGGWCVNPNNTGSSWHYTTGNDGIFQHIDETYAAWHAGDGSRVTFTKRDTGVKATNIDTVKPKTTRSNNKVYINGRATSLSATVPINSEGFLYSIGSNGNYYLGPTWTNGGVIVQKGGNYNSIGIEMAVNTGSNVYYTWQRTAKLVADIMVRRGLRLPQVGFHRNFSNKMCPQTLIRAGMQEEFFRLVATEYYVRKNYSGATITFTSSNTSILNNKGQIVKYPTQQTNVAYTIKVTHGGKTYTATLYALVPGTKDF